MNLEDRYKSSTQNRKAPAYSMTSKLVTDGSRLNIDGIPTKYNNTSRLASLTDSSKWNLDSIPTKYTVK
jgi:hypothetical protein